ncbi:spondin domain-containing protein [Congregibacter brevis]|uniref:Spondin domain-containing protein n=1 Tax=Congregibacter brevis TaxID=3081201 RepID=A0ABZ0IG65_9GAMM|nr:spondin domain-containing protein [Congregibacter sp. IMCC45268]
MKKTFASLALLATSIAPAGAAQFDVEIINLTRGSYFTPLLVAAHASNASLFTSGEAASASLQAMAEGGDISALVADVEAINATVVTNPAEGLLAPGQRTTAMLNTDDAPDNTRLSIVAMILPSNDGFMGLNAIEIPTEPGRYVYGVNAYDSGTEGNDEVVGSGAPGEPGYPAPPPVLAASGTGGTGIAATAEGFVHIHRNVLGDDNLGGGNSDIDNTVHRWLNPVVRVVVTVN